MLASGRKIAKRVPLSGRNIVTWSLLMAVGRQRNVHYSISVEWMVMWKHGIYCNSRASQSWLLRFLFHVICVFFSLFPLTSTFLHQIRAQCPSSTNKPKLLNLNDFFVYFRWLDERMIFFKKNFQNFFLSSKLFLISSNLLSFRPNTDFYVPLLIFFRPLIKWFFLK